METLTEEVEAVEAVESLLALEQDAPVELLILDSAAVKAEKRGKVVQEKNPF